MQKTENLIIYNGFQSKVKKQKTKTIANANHYKAEGLRQKTQKPISAVQEALHNSCAHAFTLTKDFIEKVTLLF